MERMTLVLAQMLNETPTNSDSPRNEDVSADLIESINPSDNSGPDIPMPGMRGVEDDIANLRSSFVSRHNMEPGAVNLSYREGGGSAGLISMSVGNEVEREATDGQKPTRYGFFDFNGKLLKYFLAALQMPRNLGRKLHLVYDAMVEK
jgi:hypothetical protein